MKNTKKTSLLIILASLIIGGILLIIFLNSGKPEREREREREREQIQKLTKIKHLIISSQKKFNLKQLA